MRRYVQPDNFEAVHALLTKCFAYMATRIDPPSSLNRLTISGLENLSVNSEIWVIEDGVHPVACMVLTAQADTLYLGKLAVAPEHRGKGVARKMIDQAVLRARDIGLDRVTLQTRIELVENQAAFAALGFHKTAETAHAGFDRPTEITMVRCIL